jgi:hypothetical protein
MQIKDFKLLHVQRRVNEFVHKYSRMPIYEMVRIFNSK